MLTLHPHPDFPSKAIRSISVDAARLAGGYLQLRYHATGAIDDVLWPAPAKPDRADRLWEHSCFEAFVGFVGKPAYVELNFTTSGQWAAYSFDGYREGMAELADANVSAFTAIWPDVAEFRQLCFLPGLRDAGEWQLGLSAIIEEKDGTKSYWALKHPPGKPDFHNTDCFAARLPAPDAP